jgi:hypothetical protein
MVKGGIRSPKIGHPGEWWRLGVLAPISEFAGKPKGQKQIGESGQKRKVESGWWRVESGKKWRVESGKWKEVSRGINRMGRLAKISAATVLIWALVAPPASAQTVNTMVQHASGEPTVDVTMRFPHGKGCGIRFSILDTVDVTVSGWVDASTDVDSLPKGFAAQVLGAVRRRLHLPAEMSTGVFGPDTLGYAAIAGAVEFTLDVASSVKGVHLVTKSTTSTLDDVLPDAVRAAAADHLFPLIPPALMNKGVKMVVTLSTVQWGSGSALDVGGAMPPLDIFGITLERYRAMQSAGGLQVPPPLQIYQQDSVSGPPIWVEFVLSPDGHVTPGTMRVIGSPPPAVAAQVGTLIMKATMTPATIAGCAVPQLVRAAVMVGKAAA